MAWQSILPEVTVWGFEKYCISSAMDGTDDDMMWNGSKEDGNARSEQEEDEGPECEDGDRDTGW
jgi:hypothetical protein